MGGQGLITGLGEGTAASVLLAHPDGPAGISRVSGELDLETGETPRAGRQHREQLNSPTLRKGTAREALEGSRLVIILK